MCAIGGGGGGQSKCLQPYTHKCDDSLIITETIIYIWQNRLTFVPDFKLIFLNHLCTRNGQ